MKVFLSYPSEYRALVEPIQLALRAQGHKVFFDRADLPPGEEYDIRIRKAIEGADLFVFMLGPDAIDAGSYTLTELEIAQKTWAHPAGHVLPVMLHPVGAERIPSYLEAVTFLQPGGNVTATVADAVHRIALARRKALRARLAKGLVAIVIVGAGASFWWTHRPPALARTGVDGTPAVLVPAGAFTMGDGEDTARRSVYLDAYYIDAHEVTTARYAKFLEATGSVDPPEGWDAQHRSERANLPVAGVDWRDAEAYCRWAGRRLPSEAEWEKAARGIDARAFPWGADEPAAARARFAQPVAVPYEGQLAAVGSHASGRSPYGVHDLAGNVSEWVADWYSEKAPQEDTRNPRRPADGTARVIRGGGLYDPAERLRAARRYFARPDTRADDIGFRCAQDTR